MARFDIEGIDDLVKELDGLEFDRIAPKMLEEAVPILERNVKKHSEAHRDSGEMASSIKATKARAGKDGYSVAVRPTGTDKKGVRNMGKLVYLEYGTSKQKATPVLTPSVRESEEPVRQKMQEVFDREAGG